MLALLLRGLLRDWRSGELTLLCLAMVIAMTCVSSLSIFSTMAKDALTKQTAQLLGADLVVRSSVPISKQWQQLAATLAQQQSESLSFLSMVQQGDHLQLAQIKAVKSPYPLRGTLRIANSLYGKDTSVATPPAVGTVWLAPRLFPLLHTKVGMPLKIGAATFKIAGVLTQEPGQSGDWFNISPRILMNWQDIDKTQVVQPGSRLKYRWLLVVSKKNMAQLQQQLQSKLTAQQQLLTPNKSSPAIARAIERTLNYLNLGGLMSLLLAAVAVSLASQRYAQRHQQ